MRKARPKTFGVCVLIWIRLRSTQSRSARLGQRMESNGKKATPDLPLVLFGIDQLSRLSDEAEYNGITKRDARKEPNWFCGGAVTCATGGRGLHCVFKTRVCKVIWTWRNQRYHMRTITHFSVHPELGDRIFDDLERDQKTASPL
jgi:hypothetical protein